MKCPVDDAVLVMSERSGVEIDYCPTCRGVWLDRGELDKILDRAAQDQPQPGYPPAQPGYPPQQPYRRRGGFFGSAPSAPSPDDYYRGGHGRPRRRRSWLDDLFD